MPEIWAHGLTVKLQKSRQAKFFEYFHVIVIHINTCMRLLPESNADSESLLANTTDFGLELLNRVNWINSPVFIRWTYSHMPLENEWTH